MISEFPKPCDPRLPVIDRDPSPRRPRTHFSPSPSFELGIRGGPILPRDIVSAPAFDEPLVPEPSRYALLYSPVAPSGQKAALVAALYDLLDIVSVLVPGAGRLEPVDGASPGYRWSGTVSAAEGSAARVATALRTPALVDVRTMQVLTNDPYALPYAFRELAARRPGRPGAVLAQTADEDEERSWDARIFTELHAGVYRAGFVTQTAYYEQAVSGVYTFLHDLDKRLGRSRYLLGEQLVPTDLWLFSLLVRYDQVYGPGFRLHRYRVRDFANVYRYLRELYGIPACAFTTDFPAISAGYYLGIPALNRGIVPIGPDELFLSN
jgi:putative glutathione S-transferase